MAKVGLKHLITRDIPTDETPTPKGKIFAGGINVDIAVTSNEVEMYYDDGLGESLTEFNGGTLTAEVDDIPDESYCDALGHKLVNEEIVCNENDIAPFKEFGFVRRKRKNNKDAYIGVIYLKIQWTEPNDTAKTKGKNTELTSSTIVANLYKNDDGNWKKQKTFATEAEAISYINTNLAYEAPTPASQQGQETPVEPIS